MCHPRRVALRHDPTPARNTSCQTPTNFAKRCLTTSPTVPWIGDAYNLEEYFTDVGRSFRHNFARRTPVIPKPAMTAEDERAAALPIRESIESTGRPRISSVRSTTSARSANVRQDGKKAQHSKWRHTVGILLLLVTVVLWTASNFLASVRTPRKTFALSGRIERC